MSLPKIILTILFFYCLTSFSQPKNHTISGFIKDSKSKTPIEYASVVLYRLPDTTLLNGVITNHDGAFKLQNVPIGNYLMKINFMGYRQFLSTFEVENSNKQFKDPFLLQQNPNDLEGVEVTSSKMNSTKTTEGYKINLKDSPDAISGSILDVIKQNSMISIDETGNVFLRGNSNVLILLDGMPVNASFLQTISAESLQSIEIITTPDSKNDAEGTAGIINMVSKKEIISGLSGEIALKVAFPFHINGGVQLNFAQPRYNLIFQYHSDYLPEDIQSSIYRELKNSESSVNQIIHNKKIQQIHQMNLLVNYKIDPKTFINLNMNSSIPKIDQTQQITGDELFNTIDNTYHRINEITFKRITFFSTLTLGKIFIKNKQEFSTALSFSRIKGSRPAEYYIDHVLSQKSFGGGAPTNASIQVDYYKPLWKIDKMEMGAKWFYRWNDFNYSFYDYDFFSNNWVFNSIYSNDLQHKEHIISAYLMASDSLSKKLLMKLGARIEYNHSELVQVTIKDTTSYSYISPFPFAMLKYQFNKQNLLVFQLNRRITRPNYPQLNPYINLIDQLTYETGNKNVRPEIVDKVELAYSYTHSKWNLNMNIYSSLTQRFITQVSVITIHNQLALTYVNGNQQWKHGCDLDFTYTPIKWVHIQSGASVFYTKTSGFYNEVNLYTDNLAWKGNLRLTINPWKNGDIQLTGSYLSPTQLPQFSIDEIYYFNLSYSHKLWKNKLLIQLSIVDLFNTQKWVIHSDNHVYKLENISKGETRKVWIGFTYKFNSYKPTKPTKSNGNEEDSGIIRY